MRRMVGRFGNKVFFAIVQTSIFACVFLKVVNSKYIRWIAGAPGLLVMDHRGPGLNNVHATTAYWYCIFSLSHSTITVSRYLLLSYDLLHPPLGGLTWHTVRYRNPLPTWNAASWNESGTNSNWCEGTAFRARSSGTGRPEGTTTLIWGRYLTVCFYSSDEHRVGYRTIHPILSLFRSS